MAECLRLNMWSGPRNVSTALMYAFRQRSDTKVFDEPLYGHYLSVTDVRHPGDDEVIASMNCNGEEVVQTVLLAECDTPVRFYKNMAHHLTHLNRDFLNNMTNLLLTRDPKEMLPSLAQNIPNPTLRDTGLKEQTEIMQHILSNNQRPIILDAKYLLQNPESVLRQTCEHLNIPFEPRMLSWDKGPKTEDGIWAKHWYHNVHNSTGFAPYKPKTSPFPQELELLLAECTPYYEALLPYVIRP